MILNIFAIFQNHLCFSKHVQNHIYLNRNIFCLNCHGLLVLLVRVISSLCIETHKVESAKEIKRSAKEIWDRNGMKESHEIVQVSPSRSVFPVFIHLKIFLSQTTSVHFNLSRLSYPITDDFDQKGTHRVQKTEHQNHKQS